MILANAYQFDIPDPSPGIPSLADIWVTAFQDLNPGTLNAAFQTLLQNWIPRYVKFPAPGDLRAIVNAPKLLRREADAEAAWQEVLKELRHFHPDLGWYTGTRTGFTGTLQVAVKAAGGVTHLWNATRDQLVWAKKDFLACYLREVKLAEPRHPLLEAGHELAK